jgi:hypothetical protein
MGLCWTYGQHFDAGIHQNEIAGVQAYHAQKIQMCPYLPEPKKFGTEAQAPLPHDSTPKLDANGIKRVQKIVGSILYYSRAVNMTVLIALSTIAVEQTKATEKTMAQCTQLLDYLSGHVDAKVRFHASDMILNIHSDASYLLEANARSRACGHFFMGWMPQDGKSIRLNGAFHVSTTIFCVSLSPPLPRQNWVHSTTIARRGLFFDSPSQKLVTHNQKNLSIVTTPWRWELRTIQSNDSARNQWK